MLRRVLVWTPVGGLALWAAVRLSGLDDWYPMVQLLAFTPYVAAFAVLPLVVTLALRRWWAAAVSWRIESPPGAITWTVPLP